MIFFWTGYKKLYKYCLENDNNKSFIFFNAVWAVPAITIIRFWFFGKTHTWKMKPFNAALWTIACNHVSVWNILAIAVCFFNLVTHVLYFLYLCTHKSWVILYVIFIYFLSLNLLNSIKVSWNLLSLWSKLWKVAIVV